jgi:uroporphyrinogen-III synthase
VKRLFISKSILDLANLPSFCETNGISLVAQSLIRFEAVPFTLTQPCQVIFFGSIRAVRFFLQHAEMPTGVAVACIGSTTAERIRSLGIEVDFIGDKSGQPDRVADDFVRWVGQRRVLIPSSEQSNRAIAKKLPIDQYEEVHVYRTLDACQSIADCDGYVFTSPSNVKSFLTCNPKPVGIVIAWGETTAKALREAKIHVTKTLHHSTEEALIECLTRD